MVGWKDSSVLECLIIPREKPGMDVIPCTYDPNAAKEETGISGVCWTVILAESVSFGFSARHYVKN